MGVVCCWVNSRDDDAWYPWGFCNSAQASASPLSSPGFAHAVVSHLPLNYWVTGEWLQDTQSTWKNKAVLVDFLAPVIFDIQQNFFLSRASFKFVLFWYKNNLSISSCLLQTETRRCGVPICGGRSNCISSILGFNVMPKFNQIEWSPDPCFLELSSLLQYTWCIFCHQDRAWRGIFLEIYLTKESQQLCARSVRFQFSTQGLPSAASGGSTKVSPFLVDIGALGDAGMTIFLTPIHVRPTNKGY